MRLIIALIFPWATFFTIGRPIACLACFLLQITLIGWLPATIWVVYALSRDRHKTDMTNRAPEPERRGCAADFCPPPRKTGPLRDPVPRFGRLYQAASRFSSCGSSCCCCASCRPSGSGRAAPPCGGTGSSSMTFAAFAATQAASCALTVPTPPRAV